MHKSPSGLQITQLVPIICWASLLPCAQLVLILYPSATWGNWGFQRGSNLPKVTDLMSQDFSVNFRTPLRIHITVRLTYRLLLIGRLQIKQPAVYLLASSLTLSTSAINETSLSMMLGRNKTKQNKSKECLIKDKFLISTGSTRKIIFIKQNTKLP